MNYELAKKLKDAEFPLKEWQTDMDDEACQPTLSELIGACGDGTSLLDRGKDWERFGYPNKYLATNSQAEGHHKGHGLTPEESVANLWLALNTKK